MSEQAKLLEILSGLSRPKGGANKTQKKPESKPDSKPFNKPRPDFNKKRGKPFEKENKFQKKKEQQEKPDSKRSSRKNSQVDMGIESENSNNFPIFQDKQTKKQAKSPEKSQTKPVHNKNSNNNSQQSFGVNKSDINLQQNIVIKRRRSSCDVYQEVPQKKLQKDQNEGVKLAQINNKDKKKKNKQQQQPKISSNWQQFQKKSQEENNSSQLSNMQDKQDKKGNKPKRLSNHLELFSLIPDPSTFKGKTPIVAIDCEMVMCEDYEEGQKHLLARVSIVNYNGHILLDSYVNPQRKVTNYLTWVSGIQPQHIKGAPSLKELKPKIDAILNGRIIVGHTIKNDFEALNHTPNQSKVRDISKYSFLKNQHGRLLSLKNMNEYFLNLKIQKGQHSSIEDAQATMLIYRKFEKQIEQEQKEKSKSYTNLKSKLLNDIQQN